MITSTGLGNHQRTNLAMLITKCDVGDGGEGRTDVRRKIKAGEERPIRQAVRKVPFVKSIRFTKELEKRRTTSCNFLWIIVRLIVSQRKTVTPCQELTTYWALNA